MRIPFNVAVAFLAMFMASPLAFAQDSAQGFGPDQEEMDPTPAHHCMCHERTGMREHREPREKSWGRERARFMLERLVESPSMREQLGITPEQAAKIRQQTSDFRKSEIRNRADLKVKRIELNDLLSADKPDRAAIDKKLQELSAAHLAVMKAGVDFRLAMRNALTPEQREKLEKMREERRGQGRKTDSQPAG